MLLLVYHSGESSASPGADSMTVENRLLPPLLADH